MTFDPQEWKHSLRGIPEGNFPEALRAMLDERKRREALPMLRHQQNASAAAYHAANPAQEIDGVPVWSQPQGEWDAYPAGSTVHHHDQVWDLASQDICTQEPGVCPEWIPREQPEQAPEPEPTAEDHMNTATAAADDAVAANNDAQEATPDA